MPIDFADNNPTSQRVQRQSEDVKGDPMLSVTRSKTIQPFSTIEEPSLMAQKLQRNVSNTNVLPQSVLSSVALGTNPDDASRTMPNSTVLRSNQSHQQTKPSSLAQAQAAQNKVLSGGTPALIRSVSLSHDVLQQQFRRTNTIDDLQPKLLNTVANDATQNPTLSAAKLQQEQRQALSQAYAEQQQQQEAGAASMNPFGSLNLSPFQMNALQTPAYPNSNFNPYLPNLANLNMNTSVGFNPAQSVVSQLFTPNFGPYGANNPSLPQLSAYTNAFGGNLPQTPNNQFGSYGSYSNLNFNPLGGGNNANANLVGSNYPNYLLSPNMNAMPNFSPALTFTPNNFGIAGLGSTINNNLNNNINNGGSNFSMNTSNLEYFPSDDNTTSYSTYNHHSNNNNNNHSSSNNSSRLQRTLSNPNHMGSSTILSNNLYPANLNVNPYSSNNNNSNSLEKSRAEPFLEDLRMKLKASPTNAAGNGLNLNLSGMNMSSNVNNMNMGQHNKSSIAGTNTFCSKNIYLESGITFGLSDILGLAYDFSRDQLGSRFLQFQLESDEVSKELKDQLFSELMGYVHVLCKDVFGNYVVQKLLDLHVGTKSQHNYIVGKAIRNHVVELSTHMYGCRVVQKLVEQIFGFTSHLVQNNVGDNNNNSESSEFEDCYLVEVQDKLLDELRGDILQLVTDQNGNHVVQKCIEQILPISRLDFFFTAFRDSYVVMAKHPYGCRVVQRVLEHATVTERARVLTEVLGSGDNILGEMIQDQYANYVVQHVIENNLPYCLEKENERFTEEEKAGIESMKSDRKKLFKLVGANVLLFSQHKFGSNVVESCLKFGNEVERSELIDDMLKGNSLVMMMKDPYANYVVQKLIDKSNNKQLSQVMFLVGQNETTLRRLTYGKHILNKIKSLQN